MIELVEANLTDAHQALRCSRCNSALSKVNAADQRAFPQGANFVSKWEVIPNCCHWMRTTSPACKVTLSHSLGWLKQSAVAQRWYSAGSYQFGWTSNGDHGCPDSMTSYLGTEGMRASKVHARKAGHMRRRHVCVQKAPVCAKRMCGKPMVRILEIHHWCCLFPSHWWTCIVRENFPEATFLPFSNTRNKIAKQLTHVWLRERRTIRAGFLTAHH